MDCYGTDRKLSELGEQDLEDFLDQDMFTPNPTDTHGLDSFALVAGQDVDECPMDSDNWLDNFFDDPVLNDRMMTDAIQPRRVQSEHSYSLANEGKVAGATGALGVVQVKTEGTNGATDNKQTLDLDIDLLGSAINPNMTLSSGSSSLINTTFVDSSTPTITSPHITIKQEPSPMSVSSSSASFITPDEITMATNSIVTNPSPPVTMTTRVTPVHAQTILKQPTIILATGPNTLPLEGDSLLSSSLATTSVPSSSSSLATVTGEHTIATSYHSERVVLPKVNIKMEPYDTNSNLSSPEHAAMYDSIGLPPTPPSSSNSDSEGGNSPQRSAPPSPIRHGQARSHHSLGGVADAFSQPLFTSPIPTSGVLILSEEEKRTLVTEGYPIPNKLPLTKQEEKNLKKIRRKIKNKISAQESRRKKKEYLETLEKKVEAFNCENSDLRKKVESLENNNRSLLGQLQKLQSIVAKMPRPTTPSSQTGTCLMVLVLFFAVFMGTWSSPMSWTAIGYGSGTGLFASNSPSSLAPVHANSLPIESLSDPAQGPQLGPDLQEPVSDAYTSYNKPRSRVLLSIKDDVEDGLPSSFGPDMPYNYQNFFTRWFASADTASCQTAGQGGDGDYTITAPAPRTPAAELEPSVDDRETSVVADEPSLDLVAEIALNVTARVTTATPINATA